MMGLSNKQIKFTHDIALLIEYCRVNEVGLTFSEALRTDEQQLLYYYGKSIKVVNGNELKLINGKVRSKTLNSLHKKRLAVDFNFFIKGKLTYNKKELQHIGDFWESLDSKNKWGGNFTSFIDTPHFQRSL